jgi:hypothetical protein
MLKFAKYLFAGESYDVQLSCILESSSTKKAAARSTYVADAPDTILAFLCGVSQQPQLVGIS